MSLQYSIKNIYCKQLKTIINTKGIRMKKLLTTKELAECLNVHPASISRKVIKGEIPFYRLSKTDLRFDLEEVLAELKKEG
tara:strand:- start:4 stop:246 length:243 start_codon:yes stop_codon:yes gene_type:complete